MSFILDALRKSEHARQRQTGPGLAEAPIAPTKARTNVWATAAVALLLVGEADAISRAAKELGNSPKQLNHPQIVPIFVGIALGVLVGLTDIVSREDIEKAVTARAPRGTEEMNRKALEAGFTAAEQVKID